MTNQLPHTRSGNHAPYPHGTHGQDQHPDSGSHRGHRLMMIACCIPMLIIAGLLIVTGVAGSGTIIFVVACVAMMALMMFAMPNDHRH